MTGFISIKEASAIADVSRRTIERALKKLSSTQLGHVSMYDRDAKNRNILKVSEEWVRSTWTSAHVNDRVKSSTKNDVSEVEFLREQLKQAHQRELKLIQSNQDLIESNREYQHTLDQVNSALIKMRIPELIEAQVVKAEEVDQEEAPTKKPKPTPINREERPKDKYQESPSLDDVVELNNKRQEVLGKTKSTSSLSDYLRSL